MAQALSAMPNERLEVLKARSIPTPGNQQLFEDRDGSKIMDHHLYVATRDGDVEKFIVALEEVSKSRKLALSLIFDQVTPSGNSLLHVAASSGKEDVMELILSHYPDLVTRKNSSEDTPLHVAVQDGSSNATKKLICLGRDSEIMYWKNKDSKSPLYLAVEKCEFSEWKGPEGPGWEILQLLLQVSARDEDYAVKIQGMSPVLAALKQRKPEKLFEEIIDRLPKLLRVHDEDGGTPLHSAASVGNLSAVQLLLRECPYLALQTDKNGTHPIHIACKGGNCGMFWFLKQRWPNLAEIKDKKGQNILHVAAKAGIKYMVQYLLEECGKPLDIELVNSQDVDGNTPLHLASMHNHCEVMRFLTKYQGSNVGLQNNDGMNALDVAMESRSLSRKNPALLGRAILIVAGIRRSEGQAILSPREQRSGVSKTSRAEWIKDQVNTLLLVATLVASVTFTAGLTLPSGYNASSDPHPGTATMLHNGVFKLFVIANTLAMYSSILAVVVLLWGLSSDFYIAKLAYHSAGPLLLMALAGMSVAFFAAVTVAVSKLTWLGSLVLSVGVLYLAMVIAVLAALIFPFSKSAMRIVCLYYVSVTLWVSAVQQFVQVCLDIFRTIKAAMAIYCNMIFGPCFHG